MITETLKPFLRNTEKIIDRKEMDINLFSTKKRFYFNYIESNTNLYKKILITKSERLTDIIASIIYNEKYLEYVYVDDLYRKTNLIDLIVFLIKRRGINKVDKLFTESRSGRTFMRNYGFRVFEEK